MSRQENDFLDRLLRKEISLNSRTGEQQNMKVENIVMNFWCYSGVERKGNRSNLRTTGEIDFECTFFYIYFLYCIITLKQNYLRIYEFIFVYILSCWEYRVFVWRLHNTDLGIRGTKRKNLTHDICEGYLYVQVAVTSMHHHENMWQHLESRVVCLC